MRILAIETSCDDTGVAVLEVEGGKTPHFNVLSNIVSSQVEVHKQYGGVFPMMAKREHQKNLVPVVINSLKEAKLLREKKETSVLNDQKIKDIFEKEPDLYKFTKKFLENYEKPEIDAVAVTYGPGLEPCLWTGVNFARTLCYFWKIPLIPVNHIEAHILVNLLNNQTVQFPALSLVVSGGHTQLILVKKIGQYKIIGETLDDAAGECFDKAAKILGLGYPGGPIVSKIASSIDKSDIELPRPMIHSKDYDFSFSGLKTAVLYKVRDMKENSSSFSSSESQRFVSEMCFEVQQAIVDVLSKKTFQAVRDFKAKTLILGGGVSANKELRRQFAEKIQKESLPINLVIPEPSLSTDNALMIAVTGYFNQNKKTKSWKKLKADANLRISK